MKTAPSSDEVEARRIKELLAAKGWVDVSALNAVELVHAAAVWRNKYKTNDLHFHFKAATRAVNPNKVSSHRMDIFTDAYNLAKLRGEI